MWLDDERTALYRFFDKDGALLYVGITHNVAERWTAHSFKASWWPDVAEKTVEWHETRSGALAAERAAIQAERPRHNVAGAPWVPRHRDLTEEERTVGQLRANLTEFCQRVQFCRDVYFVVDRKRIRERIAVLVPVDFYEQALADRARLAADGRDPDA